MAVVVGVSASENRAEFMKEGFCCFYVKFYDKQDEQEFLSIIKDFTARDAGSLSYEKEGDSSYKVYDLEILRMQGNTLEMKAEEEIRIKNEGCTDPKELVTYRKVWDRIYFSVFMESKWGMLFRKYNSMAKEVRVTGKEKYYPIRFAATKIPAGLGKRIAA